MVGIALDALQGDIYKMRIGTNSTVYEAPVSDVLVTGQKWLNRKGKVVVITPVDLFTKKESKDESTKLHSVPVPETPREIQRSDSNCGRDLFS